MVKDFLKFEWDWLKSLQKTMTWGPLTTNLLLVSMEGNKMIDFLTFI
jgi:hypoxia-inducible factor 1-alpha inhibitor (HIF hydroxylase)